MMQDYFVCNENQINDPLHYTTYINRLMNLLIFYKQDEVNNI